MHVSFYSVNFLFFPKSKISQKRFRLICCPMKSFLSLLGVLLGSAAISLMLILGLTVDLSQVQIHLALDSYPLHPAENSRLVVSLSTFSRRVPSSLLTVQSIIKSGKYELLIISIPLIHRNGISSQKEADLSVDSVLALFSGSLGAFKPVPGKTLAFFNPKHAILMQFLNEDFGPATKLIGALLVEKEPSTIILTVDDDIVYSPSLLPFVRSNAPYEAAFSAVCQVIKPPGNSYLSVHDGAAGARWLWRIEPKYCPGWLVGWAGVAYRVGFFSSDLFTMARNLSSDCFLNDDVWLSGYLHAKGISRVVFPTLPGGKHFRHPTLSLSVIPDAQTELMIHCAHSMGFK